MAATPILDVPLTSLTGFTTSGGTWTADGTGIHQTSMATTTRRAMYGTAVPLSIFGCQVDIRLDGTTGGMAGMSFRIASASTTGSTRYQFSGNGTNITALNTEIDEATAGATFNLATPIPYGTYATLGIVMSGAIAALYVNGTFQTSMTNGATPTGSFLSLSNYATAASWRNLKVWGPTVPW